MGIGWRWNRRLSGYREKAKLRNHGRVLYLNLYVGVLLNLYKTNGFEIYESLKRWQHCVPAVHSCLSPNAIC